MVAACKPSSKKTIESIKMAIDSKAAASVKYAAFAEQATSEGYPGITALFQASSEAENLQVKNYQDLLKQLGVEDYTPAVPDFNVKSTAENLQVAMDAAKYESEVMYPELIKAAEAEKAKDAILYMTYAKEAQNGNSMVYYTTLQCLNAGAEIPAAYFVCPKCGIVFAGDGPEHCLICMVPSSEFLGFHGVMPLDEPLHGDLLAEPLRVCN